VHAAAAAWFVALAIVISYPLVVFMDTHVPGGGAGDNLTFLWNSWWAREVAAGAGSLGYFHTTYLFAPFGVPLVLNTHTALESTAAAVAFGGVPVVRAHNLILLAGLAANGFAAYGLAFWFVRRVLPAIVAGTSFATCAYLTVHLLGHVNLIHAWVLPLAALALIAFAAAPSLVRAGGVALAFAATAWSDYYYLVYASLFAGMWLALLTWSVEVTWPVSRPRGVERALMTMAAVAAGVAATIWVTGGIAFDVGAAHVTAQRARNPTAVAGLCVLLWAALRTRVAATRAPDRPCWRSFVVPGSFALLMFGVLTAPVTLAAFALLRSGGYVSQPYFWRSGPRGIDLATVIFGPPMHPAVGSLTSALDLRLGIDRIEQTAWLGIVASVLVIAAVRSRAALGPDARRWLWVCGMFAVWSLGPSLSIGGTDTGLFLPQTLVRVIPVVSNARMPGRAMVMVQLASAVLGAMVLSRSPRKPLAFVLIVGAIILESLSAPFPLYRLPEADAIDAQLSGSAGAVLELPSGLRDGFGEWGRFDSRALVHQMTHGRPLVGGFSARLPPHVTDRYRNDRALAALFDLSSGKVEPEGLPLDLGASLTRSEILHVVVNADALTVPVRGAFEQRGLRLVAEAGARRLYEVVR
jgi:hypothetical protein